ncbi:MAG: hypothetical protein OXE81_12885, partial [Gammaproteobacteria bacterium]|nr:hypothetical protein [Gammaproteobacteria bacterium]
MHRTRPDEKLDDLHVVGDLMGRYSSSPRSAVARVMAAALLSALLLAGLSTQAAAQTVPAITIHGGAAVTEGGYAIFTVT